jgi:hypothetical protein
MDYTDYGSDDLAYIREVMETALDTKSGFALLVDYCQAKWPHELWHKLRLLDVDGDIEQLLYWLTHVFATEPPPDTIKALWFGLFNPSLGPDVDDASCDIYFGLA